MADRSTNPEESIVIYRDLEKINIYNPSNDAYDSDDSIPNIECDLCCKEFSSVKMYEQHLNSKKHHQMLTKTTMRQKVGKYKTQNGQTSNTLGGDSYLEGDDPPEEISCEICSKNFSGYIPYITHLKSSVHTKNLKKQSLKEQMKDFPGVIENEKQIDEDEVLQKPFALCTPCNKRFYDPIAFQQHLKGSSHKKKMQEKKTIESLKSQEIDDSIKVNDEDEFYSKCDLCKKGFSGPVPYKMHLHSSVHQKELKRAQIEDELKDFFTRESENQKLICKECKKTFTDPFALKNHLQNNSHEKQKAKDAVFDFAASYPEIVAVKSVRNISSDEENTDRNYQNGSYFFVCKLCHMSFSGPEAVRDHVQSKKHIQVKKEKEDRKKLLKMMEKINGEKSVEMSDAPMPNHFAVETSTQKLSKESEMNDFEFI